MAVVLAVMLSTPGGSATASGALPSGAGNLGPVDGSVQGALAGGQGAPIPGQTLPVAGEGLSTARQGLSAARQVLSATGQGLSATGQGLSAAGQGLSAARQGVPGTGQGVVAEPRVVARAAIVADEATGQVLFERNGGAARAMASTTKVMTALLALERLDERRVVVIGSGPPRVGEESLRLRKGERLTVRQLLLGLLVKSANDAGVALAEAVDGSEAAFVRRMNRKAAALGLRATHYVTPYGLDRPGHQTSARDLARLWEVAMRRADFRSLVATRAARLPGGPLSLRRFVTTNELLGSYRWTVGGKTGFTNRAGRCLVASASRGGRRLVAVALGSTNAFTDVRALFEYGFSKFVRVRLAQRGQPVSAAPGRPDTFQATTDVDALVRLDQLTKVRLLAASGPEGQPAGTGAGAGSSGGGVRAWFVAAGRRLTPVFLGPAAGSGAAPTAGGGATPTSTPAAPTPSSGATAGTGTGTGAGADTGSRAGTGPGSSIGSGAGTGTGTGPANVTGGPTGATLVAGTPVRVWPVPPGAPAPVIDPLLRRAPR